MGLEKFKSKKRAKQFAKRCRARGFNASVSPRKDINKRKKGNQSGFAVSFKKR